jgi:threonine dehydratase
MSAPTHLVTFEQIVEAAERIKPWVRVTPLMEKPALTSKSGFSVMSWKMENIQITGSFKFRGAVNALLSTPNYRDTLALTQSSGNHGAALARAAVVLGCKHKTIVVAPNTSPEPKVEAMKACGAEVIKVGPNEEFATMQQAREVTVERVLKKLQAEGRRVRIIHPYADIITHQGAGTCGLELMQQFRDAHGGQWPDVVVIPVGGGGFCSGAARAIKALSQGLTLVVAAEPKNADDASRSFVTGRIENNANPQSTMADGARTTLAESTLACIRRDVDCFVTVTEEEIAQAMMLFMVHTKQIIEPTAGVPVAVALFKRDEILAKCPGRRCESAVSIVCGGNVDLLKLSGLLAVGIKGSSKL